MKKNIFKSIKVREIAKELRDISANVETYGCDDDESAWCDVRLQVYPDGCWWVRYGSPDYDQDHRGYWGCSCVPGVRKGKVVSFNSISLAKDLLDQCEESFYQDGDF